MQSAIERVMTTYGMMAHLTPEQEQEARERVEKYLRDRGTDEHVLVVAGLKYLRGRVTKRRGVARESVQHCVE